MTDERYYACKYVRGGWQFHYAGKVPMDHDEVYVKLDDRFDNEHFVLLLMPSGNLVWVRGCDVEQI